LGEDSPRNWEDQIHGLSKFSKTVVCECGQSSFQKSGNGLKGKHGKHGIVQRNDRIKAKQGLDGKTIACWQAEWKAFVKKDIHKC
jgi:hypothetical protein